MPTFYEILEVSPTATAAEIKSAYRRLAHELHPDKNAGSEESANRFSEVSKAYDVLSSSKKRAQYDLALLHYTETGATPESVFASQNYHAKRWQRIINEQRYNAIIDNIIAAERREALAFQHVVLPTVALFISTIVVFAFKPAILETSGIFGKIIIFSLFLAAVVHLFSRFKEGFSHYTWDDQQIHESILEDQAPPEKPYSRTTAVLFLAGGLIVCSFVGILLGFGVQAGFGERLPAMFSPNIIPGMFLYPPIVAFLVDAMHRVMSKFDAASA